MRQRKTISQIKPNKWQWKIIAKICVNGPIRDFVLNGTKITRNTTNEPTTTEEWREKKNCKIKSESTVSKHALTYTDDLEFWNCAIAQKIARGWPIYENHLKNCTISLSVDFWLHKQFVCCCYFYFSSFSSFHSLSLALCWFHLLAIRCWRFIDETTLFFQIDADYWH